MEKTNIKKIVLCVITVITICIIVIAIKINNKDTDISNNIKNEIQQEEMPQEQEINDIDIKEPSSSEQVGAIK